MVIRRPCPAVLGSVNGDSGRCSKSCSRQCLPTGTVSPTRIINWRPSYPPMPKHSSSPKAPSCRHDRNGRRLFLGIPLCSRSNQIHDDVSKVRRTYTMQTPFSKAEQDFVRDGGNLWYVGKVPRDGWNVIRWSERNGHCIVVAALPTEERAEQKLWEFVRPSSERARTVIHHVVSRPNREANALFPHLI